MHRRMGSATLSQLASPGEKATRTSHGRNPNGTIQLLKICMRLRAQYVLTKKNENHINMLGWLLGVGRFSPNTAQTLQK